MVIIFIFINHKFTDRLADFHNALSFYLSVMAYPVFHAFLIKRP